MADSDKVFAGSIPELYDHYLVPLIFESYAQDLVQRVRALSPIRVLETAAGSGVVTRQLADQLPQEVTLTITDLNQPMLDHAAKRQGEDSRISWRQADALDLPFDDGSFDAVVCQFGVMFFPDRVAGFREARRVLAPHGAFLFNVWDRIEANVFADVVTKAASEFFPHDPPLFLARTPHGYHDPKAIRKDLDEAGFKDIETETITRISRSPTARQVALAYCQGTPLRSEIEARDPSILDEVTRRAEEVLVQRFGTGEVAAQIQGHVLVARA